MRIVHCQASRATGDSIESVFIDKDFPGGNVHVERLDGDTVYLHQETRDTTRPWFYWYFRVRGAGGRTLTFVFTQSRAVGVRGPAVSYDSGLTWRWLGESKKTGTEFTFSFPEGHEEVRFSFALPYVEEHWNRFLGTIQSPLLRRRTLCTTEQGREADYVLLGDSQKKQRIMITCRHHSCEMIGNYSVEGLIRWYVRHEDERAQWMRENTQLLIVPFVDKDGVEQGDQGKARSPRDHGRDYAGRSIYTTTAAIRDLVQKWGNEEHAVGLDLHCPHISGRNNETIYLTGSADSAMEREQRRFSRLLERHSEGALPVSADDFLPFGTEWNTEANFADGMGFGQWLTTLGLVTLGCAIEIPYATARGVEVTQESARDFGETLGKALAEYMGSLRH